MDNHKHLIERFYTSFQNLDSAGMVNCYHDDVLFYDPVFRDLRGEEAKSMWKMLCKTAKSFKLEFSDVKAEDEYGTCRWTASYLFSQTGSQVVNHCKARFKFSDGLIIEHFDDFSTWNWARQALGIKGLLLGWSPMVRNKMTKTAKRNLELYMKRYSNR